MEGCSAWKIGYPPIATEVSGNPSWSHESECSCRAGFGLRKELGALHTYNDPVAGAIRVSQSCEEGTQLQATCRRVLSGPRGDGQW